MRMAFVGCGFVADLYMRTLALHRNLELTGVMDRDGSRAGRFARHYDVPTYTTLQQLLDDRSVRVVVNLTNPRSHFEVSRAALLAGKHVYSEKPLAMELRQAQELVELARRQGLMLTSAPCNVLGEAAQTAWRALRENRIGRVRLVYAELDDGLVHRMPYKQWISASGAPWPYQDEFEVGCTLEHAGYYLTWLAAFFGPAVSMTTFASVVVPDKGTDASLLSPAGDFSVACITYESGVAARLTCSIAAPHDHRLRIVGDEGVLYVDDCWHYRSPVYIRRWIQLRRRMLLSPWKSRCRLARSPYRPIKRAGAASMDFCRGIAELVDAIEQGRPCRLSAAFALHVNELALAIHHSVGAGGVYEPVSTFDPVEPMPWAATH